MSSEHTIESTWSSVPRIMKIAPGIAGRFTPAARPKTSSRLGRPSFNPDGEAGPKGARGKVGAIKSNGAELGLEWEKAIAHLVPRKS